MAKYVQTIGLEVHAQLKTKTKMFCNSANDPDETTPNTNICPICLGYPGTLPTINKKAVEHVLKIGVAVGGELADYTEFDRKHYFYPDIPKGYQISQFEFPLVSGGSLEGVELTRIHLEEDTAKNTHTDDGKGSLVDFNRSGTPLMELVTEPVITSSEQAGDFARELQLLLRTLGVSDANMEKGEMRVEANISIAPEGVDEFGTKVEVKNLNSFRSVESAIEYELKRQEKALEDGEELVQETRGWDEDKQVTKSQRKKETSDDYRYFPDPDLPKLQLSEMNEWSKEKLKSDLPELPNETRQRYMQEHDLSEEDTETLLYNPMLGRAFNKALDELGETRNGELTGYLVNYITTDLAGLIKESAGETSGQAPVSGAQMARLVELIAEDTLSSRGAKDTLQYLVTEADREADPEMVAREQGLIQKSDSSELEPIVRQIIEDNPDVVEDYKAGKEESLQYFIGQGMRETQGAANPQVLKELFITHLD